MLARDLGLEQLEQTHQCVTVRRSEFDDIEAAQHGNSENSL